MTQTMTWLSALSIGLVIDLFVGFCVVLLVYADKKHEAEKHERWRSEGLYWPESVDTDEPLPPWAREHR